MRRSASEPIVVEVDRVRIERVLRNLIVNQYASLDYARVLDAARAGLADLRALVAALAADAH